MEATTNGIHRVAMLGNHLPRQCGIATFTTDLSDALAAVDPALDCFVLAMNDVGHRHAYPPRVRFEIAENDPASYRRAADFLNVNTVDIVCVQHEYGIFGGKAGSHVLSLLRELRMPIVTTLHTILGTPDPWQRLAMNELVAISDRVVVMSQHGATLLQEVHGVSPEKIDVIPHGIPTIPRDPTSKDKLGVEGKSVILTFGLLSPDKGIEHVIDAMPAILARHPDAIYIVLGATHPHVKERHGETYRLMLEARAQRLGVDSSMIFHNRFVSPRRAGRVPHRRRHLHHALPQAGADHLGHAGLRGRVRQGRDLDALPSTPASSSPTAGASSSPGATARRSRARSSACSTTTIDATRSAERAFADVGW